MEVIELRDKHNSFDSKVFYTISFLVINSQQIRNLIYLFKKKYS